MRRQAFDRLVLRRKAYDVIYESIGLRYRDEKAPVVTHIDFLYNMIAHVEFDRRIYNDRSGTSESNFQLSFLIIRMTRGLEPGATTDSLVNWKPYLVKFNTRCAPTALNIRCIFSELIDGFFIILDPDANRTVIARNFLRFVVINIIRIRSTVADGVFVRSQNERPIH